MIDFSVAVRSNTRTISPPAVHRSVSRQARGVATQARHGHSPSPTPAASAITITVRRHGTRGGYSHHVAIAAGGKGSDEHQADIVIQVSPARKGFRVSPPEIFGGDSVIGARAAIRMDSATTDANGRITGRYYSSDRVGTVTLRVNTSVARIDQRWNGVMDGSDWPYNINSPYFDYDAGAKAGFIPQFWDGDKPVPITKHSIACVVTRADVITMSETGMPAATTFKGAEGGLWAYFTPEPAAESQGVYRSTLVVPAPNPGAVIDPVVEVESVSIGARDEDVFVNSATRSATP